MPVKRLGQRCSTFGRIPRTALGLLLLLPVAGASETGEAAPEIHLNRAQQVRDLSIADARNGLPVHLHGVITYVDLSWKILFVQDSSAGIS